MEIKTILVDDEILAMRLFELECARFEDIRIIAKFESPVKAIAYAEEHDVDMAILDIEMPEMNGIELGKELRKRRKDIILIFITAHTQYAMDVYQIHAPVYLEKPYSYEDLAYALETARLIKKSKIKTTFIRTFGYFDVYAGEQLVYFANKKSKELLAYLVDRQGNSVNNEQAIDILWEEATNDKKYQSKFRRVVKDLRDTLSQYGIGEILIEHPNCRAVDVGTFECDFYQWLEKNDESPCKFNENYMAEYSWAEETIGFLTCCSFGRQ